LSCIRKREKKHLFFVFDFVLIFNVF